MKLENYKIVAEIVEKINEAKAELSVIEDLLRENLGPSPIVGNAETLLPGTPLPNTKTLKVKINTRWILNLPASEIVAHVRKRKADLEVELKTLTNSLSTL